MLPLPTNFSYGAGCLRLLPSFSFSPTGAGGTDAALAAALSRAQRTLASMGARGESVQPCAPAAGSTLSSLIVAVDSARASPYPALGDDESYALFLAAGDASALRARTVWGALRGLETLTQLVSADRAPDAAGPRLVVPAAWVNVSDRPRFSHRGLMIDTGRAFLPVPLILATLDAMASVKLNVLHWHCTDDQAFPVESVAFPNLTAAGAQQAPSRTHVYSKADVASVVEAAAMRGIRVVPEFDVPGHSSSWFAGYPLLASNCSRSDEFGVPMDPTLNTTYDLLQGLFAEMRAAFPNDFFHIGGDEVDFSCWESAPAIVAFMKAHNLTPPQLQLYFENRVVDLFQGQRQLLIWEGNAGADNTYPLADNVVVNVWKEEIGGAIGPHALAPSRKRAQLDHPRAHGDLLFLGARCSHPPTPPTPPPLLILFRLERVGGAGARGQARSVHHAQLVPGLDLCFRQNVRRSRERTRRVGVLPYGPLFEQHAHPAAAPAGAWGRGVHVEPFHGQHELFLHRLSPRRGRCGAPVERRWRCS